MNLASSETADSATPTSSGPQAAGITNVEDEDDLEEGELKDDDDDSEDDDDNLGEHINPTEPRRLLPIGVSSDNNVTQSVSSTAGTADPTVLVGDQPPKRKRKRVVRKVKRKIKVLKKVPKKKGDQQQQQPQQTPQQQQPQIQQQQQQQQQQAQHSMKQYNQQHSNQRNNHNNNNVSTNNNTNQQSEVHQQQAPLLLPHIAQHQPPPPLLPVTQQQQQQLQPLLPQTIAQQQVQPPIQPPQSTLAPTNNLDSLWEQQILMLQELQRQQHAQIIRAAATDEDLRYLQVPFLVAGAPPPQQHPPHHNNLHQPQDQQQHQPQPLLPHLHQQQHQHQPQILGQQQPPNQTPSSPDDENGKSSYEAISKMLTLLRNSSEMNESDPNKDDQQNISKLGDSSDTNSNSKAKNNVEYSLIPVLVQGIDYTKYKLLSQYEPKFKNDPRLYQQT